MNLESKQRIIGIIVLVAFIALLIPFLFTSGIKKRHKLAEEEGIAIDPIAEALGEKPSDQQIPDFDMNDTSPVFVQESIEEVVEEVTPEALQQEPIAEVQSTMAMPEQPSKVGRVGSNANEAKDVTGDISIVEIDSKPAILIESERPKAAVKVETKKPLLKSKPVVKSVIKDVNKAAKKGAPAFWSVQVGSFSEQNRAKNLVNKLQGEGFNVYLQKIDTSRGEMVRVLVGRESSRSNALSVANQIKTKLNIDGLVVGKK